jgi:predicted N-acetyltransferase YhbS
MRSGSIEPDSAIEGFRRASTLSGCLQGAQRTGGRCCLSQSFDPAVTAATVAVVHVRRATAQDADAVATLWTQAYSDDPRGGRRTPYTSAEFRNAAGAGKVIVVEDGRVLAGVVVLYEAGVRGGQIARAGEVGLSRLAVAERCRRRGLGRRLVESCLEPATEQGASALVLWSQPHQTRRASSMQLLAFVGFPTVATRTPTALASSSLADCEGARSSRRLSPGVKAAFPRNGLLAAAWQRIR